MGGYDARGNLIDDGPRTFTYDVEDRLTSAPGLGSITYDPEGRLRQTTAGSVATQFLYEGASLWAEYSAAGTVLRRYVHGAGVDEPLVWYEGSGTTDRRWLHTDEQGSIVAVTNAAGAALDKYAYGPYGEPQTWTGSRFRYTGQIMLPEAELYHYKARVYDPVLGRFMQTDPVGYEDDLNLYAYVGNDPINLSDPTGMCPSCAGAAIGGLLGGALEAGIQYLEHGEVNDLGAVAREAAIGAAAGATGAGAGALIARGAKLTRMARAAGAAEAVTAGGVAGATQAAIKGDDIGEGAAVGAVAGGAARVVGQGARAATQKTMDAARHTAVDRAAAQGSTAAKLEQSGALTHSSGQSGSSVPAAAGAIAGKVTETAAEAAMICSEPQKC